MMFAQYTLAFLLLAVYYGSVSALRFAHSPVTVDTEAIIVGRPARLKCNYVKYRTESVRQIKWFAGYPGFKSKIFDFAVTTGKKETTPLSFIRVDEASATEEELTMTLTDFRDPNMTISCEVEVVRDNGYGKLRHSKKLGESPISAVNDQRHQLLIKADPDRGRYASPGETITFSCVSKGADPAPKLSFVIEGKNVSSDIDGAHVREVDVAEALNDGSHGSSGSSEQGVAIIGTLLEVSEDLFRNNYMTVECLAHYDSFLFAKKDMALERQGSSHSRSATVSDRYSSSSDNRRNDGYGDSETPRSMYPERSGRNGGTLFGDQDFSRSLMEAFTDPARHARMMEASQAEYLLMVADNLGSDSNGDTAYVNLQGDLPYEIENKLKEGYGRFNQVSEDRVRIKMSPVRVLNVLGDSGYRVIGASSAGRDGAYAWTLEKTKFAGNGVGSGDLESGSSGRPQSEFNHADRYGRGRGY